MLTMLLTIGKELTLSGTISNTPVGAVAAFLLTPVGGVEPYTTEILSEDLPPEWDISVNDDGSVSITTSEAVTSGSFTMTFSLTDADRSPVLVTRTLAVTQSSPGYRITEDESLRVTEDEETRERE